MQVLNKNYLSKENKNKWSLLSGKRVLIINTQWNESIIKSLTKAAISNLEFASLKYDVLTVPGAYEIPYAIHKKALHYDGIVTIGCVVKGQTYHFNAIVDAISPAIIDLSIKHNTPISFGVLTVNNIQEAIHRTQDDNSNKGYEATSALLDMMLI